jgi:type IV pilus assembly protein PilO
MLKDLIKINKIDKDKIKSYLPFVIFFIVIVLFFNYIFMPQKRKLNELSSKVKNKKELLSQVEVTAQNIDELTKSIKQLEKEIAELEDRLPEQIEAKLLIETLKDITKGSRIQFVSIEPKKLEKLELAEQQQIYLELPIRVRLRCSYDELTGFIKKIENSKRLMKVSELKIKAHPQNIWEHNIELIISTFSTLKD